MAIHIDEPLAVLAASAFTVAGGIVGAWLQRRRAIAPRRVTRAHGSVELDARLDRLEQIAEATQLEVERVSEGQRLTTRVLAERAAPSVAPPVMPMRQPDYRTPH